MQTDVNESETLGQRVKRIREARGIEPGQLAAYAKVSASWVSRLEADEVPNPSGTMLAKIARVLRVSVDTLLHGETPAPPLMPEELLRQLEASLTRTPILVPVTEHPASAGFGVEGVAEYLPYMPETGERRHRFIAVEVRGDCMEPRIHAREHVIVDTDASPRPGDIVLAVHDGEIIIKGLEQHDGGMYLVALQKRPPLKVNEETRIIGVVKMVMRKP